MLGSIIAGFMILTITVSLLPAIVQEIGKACNEQMNASSVGNTLLCSGPGSSGGLITLFFVIGLLIIGISITFNAFRDFGLINDDEDYNEDKEEDLEVDEKEEIEDEDYEEEENDEAEESEVKEEIKDRVIHKKW